MDAKNILNAGFGSPGHTARAMTLEFLKKREKSGHDDLSIFKRILKRRSWVYRLMGKNILNQNVRNRIIENAEGKLPFLILADIFVTNRSRGEKYILALWQNLSLIVEVVLENYNNLVEYSDQVLDQSSIETNYRQFIKVELDKY